MWPFGKKKKQPTSKVTANADGSKTFEMSFELTGPPRPVENAVIEAFDEALAALGGKVMHAIDPSRLVGFEDGGPPVWSVGFVDVGGARPHRHLMTYGFSHALSPEPIREGIRHEYSLAVDAGTPPDPWADALLRHIARYVLKNGNDLEVGQVLPCYAPITYIPFQPKDHAMMPHSPLVALVVTDDPVLSTIETPRGVVEVRRLVGVHADEYDRIETWSAGGFAEELAKRDPLLLTDSGRASLMEDATAREVIDRRAHEEGSTNPVIVSDMYWEDNGSELVIEFPGGADAAKLLAALHGHLDFGQPLLVATRTTPPITFTPADAFDINWSPDGLHIEGRLDEPNLARIVSFIRPDAPGSVVRLPLKS